jgi:hypothetical protein
MAWIEQTKKGSRKSGGPQYYLQDLASNSRDLLRVRGRWPVRIWTPYGIVDSGLVAVSSAIGSVGHDRVQSGRAVPSVADQVAAWYRLDRNDVERIEFADSFDRDAFVICPTYVQFFGRKRRLTLQKDAHPLSVIAGHHSAVIGEHLGMLRQREARLLKWAGNELDLIVGEHEVSRRDVDERDLLRASGALAVVGIRLGPYRVRGIDCPDARIGLCGYPSYPCPVEVEEASSGFLAQHHEAHRATRVLVLCMRHTAREILRDYVDVVELRELSKLVREVA